MTALCLAGGLLLPLLAWWSGNATLTRSVAPTVFAAVAFVAATAGCPRRIVGAALAFGLIGETVLLAQLLEALGWPSQGGLLLAVVLPALAVIGDLPVLALATGLAIVAGTCPPFALSDGVGQSLFQGTVLALESSALALLGVRIRSILRGIEDREHAASDKVHRLQDEIDELLHRLASTEKHADGLDRFKGELACRLDSMIRSSETLHGTADDLSKLALRIISETTAVSIAAEDASRKVVTVASAGQDYHRTISRIGEHAGRSSVMGIAAVADAESTSATIDELTELSDQIARFTQLIAGIAGQTNLLALNATIEAARAGEQGRGFAVVATEVKQLASQTTGAAQTIAEMVCRVQDSTARSVRAISSVAASIRSLNDATATIADAVEERVRAAADIAGSVTQAAGDVGQVTRAITAIEAAADETVQGATFLRAAAADIAQNTAAIRSDIERFAADLAAKRAEAA